MTPKEKAIELYNKFYPNMSHPFNVQVRREDAKQCALICVEEILKVAPLDKYENLQSELTPEDIGLHLFEEYWQSVKEEINKP
jgi:hypothetical protein